MKNEEIQKTPKEMMEELCDLLDVYRKKEEEKEKVNKIKHVVPYGNGSQEEQDDMEDLSKTNPALYAAISSWN